MAIGRYINPSSFWFLFILFFAMINGPSWAFMDVYAHMDNVDVQTYVNLSNFEFENQSPVRRYRIVIPFLVAALEFILSPILEVIKPNDFPGDFPTIFSFMLINNVFFALFSVGLFRLCNHYLEDTESKYICGIIGVLAILTCRWTIVLSSTALVDSFLICSVILLLLGIKKKQWFLLIAAIYLGPWSKESFVFFVPMLLFYNKSYYLKILIHLILSGVLIFSFRYLYDHLIGVTFSQSLSSDLAHFSIITDSLKRLFSFHGFYEILSIAGVWNLLIGITLITKKGRSLLLKVLSPFWLLFISVVLMQALLSYELARMLYLLTPLIAILVAVSFQNILNKNKLLTS